MWRPLQLSRRVMNGIRGSGNLSSLYGIEGEIHLMCSYLSKCALKLVLAYRLTEEAPPEPHDATPLL